MRPMIHVEPTRPLRRDFAVWATAQTPKIATVSPSAFAVPAELYVDVPEELLIGALVDGHRYVSPLEDARAAGPRLLACGTCYEENGEEVHPHPECSSASLTVQVEHRSPDDRARYLAGKVTEAGGGDTVIGKLITAVIGETGTETVIPLTHPGGSHDDLHDAPPDSPDGPPDVPHIEPDPPHPPPPPGPVSGAQSGKPGYGCEDCPRVFPKARGLRMHQRQAHPNPESSEVPTSDDLEVS